MISLLVSDFRKISVSVPSIPVAVLELTDFSQTCRAEFVSMLSALNGQTKWKQTQLVGCKLTRIRGRTKWLLRTHVPYLELTSTSGAGGIGISRRIAQLFKKICSRFRLIFNKSSSGMSNASFSKSLACSSNYIKKTRPKGFSASKCDVGKFTCVIFSKSWEFFKNSLGIVTGHENSAINE